MTEEPFWSIIGRRKQGVSGCQAQTDQLTQILGELAPQQSIDFDRLFFLKSLEAYQWDLWGVAPFIFHGCTDDRLESFRRWLSGQGRQAFESVLRNPESVLDSLENKGAVSVKTDPAAYVECEILPYAIYDAYGTDKRRNATARYRFNQRCLSSPTNWGALGWGWLIDSISKSCQKIFVRN